MVMTPDILRYILDKAFLTMQELNLIVFDEAHHARKNHAYRIIMSHHYVRTDPASRPKIFGMTASPLVSKEDTEQSIRQVFDF